MALQISTSDNQMVWHTRLLMWNSIVSTALQQNKQSKMSTWKKTSCITQTLRILGGTLLTLATPEICHVSRANQFSQQFARFGISKSWPCFSTGGWSRWFSGFPSSQKFLWYQGPLPKPINQVPKDNGKIIKHLLLQVVRCCRKPVLPCRRVPHNSLQTRGFKQKKLYLHHPEVTGSTWRIYFPGFFTQVKQPSPVAAERNLMK